MSRRVTMVLALSLGALGVSAACGGRESPSAVGAPDAGGDAALPPGVDHMAGYVTCCAEGAGQCCDAGMLCEQWHGCLAAGTVSGGKGDPCVQCCKGLDYLDVMKESPDGTCVAVRGQEGEDGLVCGVCGDGVCDADHLENHCNCPADCP